MSETLIEYYQALERLEKNKPINVPKGTKITNNAVSLEAGKSKGSIKKSRPIFDDLILKINQANQKTNIDKTIKFKNEINELKKLYDNSLAREIILNYKLSKALEIIEELKSRIDEK